MSATALRWIAGGDTGVSSKAIWSHMMTGELPDDPFTAFGTWPSDPDDFGRCYRLLKLMPEWRPRMNEMGKHGRGWAALVPVWEELTAMYEAEIDTTQSRHRGRADRLYARMQELLYPKQARP